MLLFYVEYTWDDEQHTSTIFRGPYGRAHVGKVETVDAKFPHI